MISLDKRRIKFFSRRSLERRVELCLCVCLFDLIQLSESNLNANGKN